MDRYIFDPAEDAWIAYLKTVLPNIRSATNVPDERPDTWIQVTRTGGPQDLAHDHAQITFHVWAPTRAKAAALAADVHRLVLLARTLAGRPVKSKRTVTAPVYSPDPQSRADRYLFVIKASIRGRHPKAP